VKTFMLINNKTIWKERRRELRKKNTLAEEKLWGYLRRKSLGQKVYRQFSIGNYIVDFCYPRAKLVIEIDGEYHFEKEIAEYDKERTLFLETVDFRVIRFTNEQILKDPEIVIEKIKSYL